MSNVIILPKVINTELIYLNKTVTKTGPEAFCATKRAALPEHPLYNNKPVLSH